MHVEILNGGFMYINPTFLLSYSSTRAFHRNTLTHIVLRSIAWTYYGRLSHVAQVVDGCSWRPSCKLFISRRSISREIGHPVSVVTFVTQPMFSTCI